MTSVGSSACSYWFLSPPHPISLLTHDPPVHPYSSKLRPSLPGRPRNFFECASISQHSSFLSTLSSWACHRAVSRSAVRLVIFQYSPALLSRVPHATHVPSLGAWPSYPFQHPPESSSSPPTSLLPFPRLHPISDCTGDALPPVISTDSSFFVRLSFRITFIT